MRSLLCLAAILVLTGCTAKHDPALSQNSPGQTQLPEATKSEKSAESKATTSDANARPVDFTFLGITPDKESVSYKIKVNTDKAIEEVHLALKETDNGGKVVEQTM